MTREIDLREWPKLGRRERLFDALADAETRPEVRPASRQREHGEFSVLSGRARTGDAASEDRVPF